MARGDGNNFIYCAARLHDVLMFKSILCEVHGMSLLGRERLHDKLMFKSTLCDVHGLSLLGREFAKCTYAKCMERVCLEENSLTFQILLCLLNTLQSAWNEVAIKKIR